MKDKGEVVTMNAVMRSGFGNGQGSCWRTDRHTVCWTCGL